jgi:hypothetical protein
MEERIGVGGRVFTSYLFHWWVFEEAPGKAYPKGHGQGTGAFLVSLLDVATKFNRNVVSHRK